MTPDERPRAAVVEHRGDPRCSVVVPTFRRPELLERCLEAVRQLDHPSYEIIVVDSEADERVKEIASRARARYVLEPGAPTGRKRTIGGLAASGDVVAFLDDDSYPHPDWLRLHEEALTADRTLAATTGRVLPDPADTPGSRLYRDLEVEDMGRTPFRIDRTMPDWFVRANFGGIGVGPNMAFRRSLFAAGWGFREAFGPGTGLSIEENYAFYTLIRDGHAIQYVPDAVVYHRTPTTITAVEAKVKRIVQTGAAYAMLLALEERGHATEILRYAVRGGGADPPSGGGKRARRSNVNRISAGVAGSLMLARWRLRWSASERARPISVPGPITPTR